MMQLQMREQRQNGVIILTPEGRLDSGKIDQFHKIVQQRIRSGHHRLLIDCTNLVFAASSTLRVLLITTRKLNEVDGKLVLCNMNPHIRSIFDTSGFTRLMNIRETFDEAFTDVRPEHAGENPEPETAPEGGRPTEPAPPTTMHGRDAAAAQEPPHRRERVITTIALAPFRLIAAVGRFLVR